MSGPDPGSFGGVDHGAVPSVAAFEVADPAFAAGSPFHVSAGTLVGRSWACRALLGLPLRGITTLRTPRSWRSSSTAGFAVAAVGGHGARLPPGPFDDPFDRRREPGRVGRVAGLHVVVEDDAVVVVDRPGPCSRTRPACPSRPFAIGRASGSCRLTRRVAPSGVVPASRCRVCVDDLPGRVQQLGQVVDRPDQPAPTPARGRVTAARRP